MAKEIATNTQAECERKGMQLSPIEVIEGDILKHDWSDGDIVFIAAVCFPDSLIAGIADQCEKLKKGTRVISLKELPQKPYLEEYANLSVRHSWGGQRTHYYLVV